MHSHVRPPTRNTSQHISLHESHLARCNCLKTISGPSLLYVSRSYSARWPIFLKLLLEAFPFQKRRPQQYYCRLLQERSAHPVLFGNRIAAHPRQRPTTQKKGILRCGFTCNISVYRFHGADVPSHHPTTAYCIAKFLQSTSQYQRKGSGYSKSQVL